VTRLGERPAFRRRARDRRTREEAAKSSAPGGAGAHFATSGHTEKRDATGHGLATQCAKRQFEKRERRTLGRWRRKRGEAVLLLPCPSAIPETKNRRRAGKKRTKQKPAAFASRRRTGLMKNRAATGGARNQLGDGKPWRAFGKIETQQRCGGISERDRPLHGAPAGKRCWEQKAAAARDSRESFGRRKQDRAVERFLREIEVTYGGAVERRSKAKGKTAAAHCSGEAKP
jgi:hypothetical protein